MKEKIKNLQELATEELSKVESLKDLNEVKEYWSNEYLRNNNLSYVMCYWN